MIAALRRAAGLPLSPLVLALALLTAPAPAAGAEEEETGLPILESGTAAVDMGSRRLTIRYSTTVAGPLLEVRPLIELLGGELEVGPLGDSHELTVNDRTYAFGPRSDALTYGAEIVNLSQAAIAGDNGGVQVPLDVLDSIYGQQLGYDFSWNPTARLLMIRHQPARELDLDFNLVHVQGVTTVVFQFSMQPRYQLRTGERSVSVELIGDRLGGEVSRSAPADDLVRGIMVTSGGVRMQLARGAVAESYILSDPFRLVFDVYRGAPAAATGAVAPAPAIRRERASGVRTIVLDPGHGGADTGAVSPRGLEEKELTLKLALSVKRLLEERLPVRVVLTRDRDSELPLEARAALANQNKGDLFLSLHLNSARGAGARGAETYFLSLQTGAAAASYAAAGGRHGDPLFDLELLLWDLAQKPHLAGSQRLANLIQEELNTALGLRNRGVRQAPLRVLMGVAMPAVLVELGFLSNPEEEAQLVDPAYRLRLADAVVRAVGRYRAAAMSGTERGDEAVR